MPLRTAFIVAADCRVAEASCVTWNFIPHRGLDRRALLDGTTPGRLSKQQCSPSYLACRVRAISIQVVSRALYVRCVLEP